MLITMLVYLLLALLNGTLVRYVRLVNRHISNLVGRSQFHTHCKSNRHKNIMANNEVPKARFRLPKSPPREMPPFLMPVSASIREHDNLHAPGMACAWKG